MRIIVADDHPLFREAVSAQIARWFPEVMIDEVGTIAELLTLTSDQSASFDLFLLDFHMPGMSPAVVTALVDEYPGAAVAVISGTAHVSDVREVFACGAHGFIPKTATADYLEHSLKLLLSGGTSVPSEVLLGEEINVDIASHAASDCIAQLTERERQVLRRVTRGLSNKEIGRELDLAEVTIKLHLRRVFRKIGARSRSDAAVLAVKAGLV